MGKDNKQVIVLLVILLVAVILLDVGTTRLSGQASDESITTMSEEDGLQGPSTVPSSQPQQPQKTIPPVQQLCEATDITKIILSKIPGATRIVEIDDIQEGTKRYFVVVIKDSTNTQIWYIYDVGFDGRISGDDQARKGGVVSTPSGGFIGLTSTSGRDEELFWTEMIGTPTISVVKKCTMPLCTNPTRVASLANNEVIGILPSTRLYLGIQHKQTYFPSLVSCSLDPQSPDACSGSETNYRVELTNRRLEPGYGSKSLKDIGIAFRFIRTFFSVQQNKEVNLPSNGDIPSMTSIGGGYMLMFINVTDAKGNTRIDLVLVDSATGNIVRVVESVASGFMLEPLLIGGVQRDKIVSVYKILALPSYSSTIYQKKVGQNPQVILSTASNPLLFSTIELASGNVISHGQFDGYYGTPVISFDCTP